MVLGAISLGSTSFLNLTFNSVSFWCLLRLASLEKSLFTFCFTVIPHAIFEIPAIIIAGAAGFKIPYEIIRYLAGKKEQILTKEDLKEYLNLALISIILIVIAAFIEVYLTPRIAEHFLSGLR